MGQAWRPMSHLLPPLPTSLCRPRIPPLSCVGLDALLPSCKAKQGTDKEGGEQNVDALQQAGVMALLRPLLLDNVASIQQSAALALGRLANYSDELAEAVVQNEILPQAVFDSGALDSLVACLEDFDPGVKEAAAWALGYVAGHNAQLASAVVDAGAISLLVLCVQEP